jgi:hypothetical protein
MHGNSKLLSRFPWSINGVFIIHYSCPYHSAQNTEVLTAELNQPNAEILTEIEALPL